MLKSEEQLLELLLFEYYSLLERDLLFQQEFWALRHSLGLPDDEYLSDDPDDPGYFQKFTLDQAIRMGQFLRRWHFPKLRGHLDLMQALIWAMPVQEGKTREFTLRVNEESFRTVGLHTAGKTRRRSFSPIHYDPTNDSRAKANAQVRSEADRLLRAAFADLNRLEENARRSYAAKPVPPHRGARANKKAARRLYMAVMQLVKNPTSVIKWQEIELAEPEANTKGRHADADSIERNVRATAKRLGIPLRPTQLIRQSPRKRSL